MGTLEFIIMLISAVFASTGFWTFIQFRIQKREKSKDAITRLMLGIAHDKIMEQSAKFIEQGFVWDDEYGDFIKYLYEPYLDLGGDGTAEKAVEGEVKKLPMRVRTETK